MKAFKAINALIYLTLSLYSLQLYADNVGDKKVTGIYSNFTYIKEAGDLLGIEIFIIYGEKNYFVTFQSAEGVPSKPEIVLATIKNNVLKFNLSEKKSGYSGEFIGVIHGDRIVGGFKNGQLSPSGNKEIVLRKGNSYWQ